MTEQEAIKKIRAIYQDFLINLEKLKQKSNENVRAQIKSIEQKEIEKILDKINNQL